jgi:paraquat-inducible protein A
LLVMLGSVMVLALMIFYVNSSGYTEASVQPGVYFFAASAIMTMLAYGWANTVPARVRAAPASGPALTPYPSRGEPASPAGQLVTLPTNPGRRHKPV